MQLRTLNPSRKWSHRDRLLDRERREMLSRGRMDSCWARMQVAV